ncbi:hypothetical protein AGMMS50229_13770 [Campylobacterota bacterium]|nr:hypothetical protein AGMMS50229_13770 [Campylobacterota bacterium]
MHAIHLIAALVFGGFILVDRLILRRSCDQAQLLPIYKTALIPLAIAAALLIASGCFLYYDAPIVRLKAALAISTIALFFFCPIANRRLGRAARFFYRLIVTISLLATVLIGAFLTA